MGHVLVFQPHGYYSLNYTTTSRCVPERARNRIGNPNKKFQLLPVYTRAIIGIIDREQLLFRAIGVTGHPRKAAGHMLRCSCPELRPGPARISLPLALRANRHGTASN